MAKNKKTNEAPAVEAPRPPSELVANGMDTVGDLTFIHAIQKTKGHQDKHQTLIKCDLGDLGVYPGQLSKPQMEVMAGLYSSGYGWGAGRQRRIMREAMGLGDAPEQILKGQRMASQVGEALRGVQIKVSALEAGQIIPDLVKDGEPEPSGEGREVILKD